MLLLTLILSFLQTLLLQTSDSTSVVVNKITIEGNKKTKERIIFRELDFKQNDTLIVSNLPKTIELNKRKLVNTNLFVSVDIKTKIVSDNKIDVAIVLQEQWFLIPYPLFQLADRNFNEWWDRGRDFNRTVYGFDLNHTNFRGRAEKLYLHIENGFTRRIDFSYRIPYIDKAQKTGIGISFSYGNSKNVAFQSLNDTLNYIRNEKKPLKNRYAVSAYIKKRYHFYDNHSLEIAYIKNQVADTVAQLNPNYFSQKSTNQQLSTIGYFFTYDNRDNVAYPLAGNRYEFGIRKYGLLATDNLNQLDIGFGVSTHKQIYKKLFFGSSIRGKISTQNQYTYNNIRALGYDNNLVRGFELYVIDGNSFFLSRNTIRYELLNKILQLNFLKVKQINKIPLGIYPNYSFDYGYVNNKFTEINYSKLANKSIYGFGFGLDIVTYYNLVARFNYMTNSLKESRFVFNIGRDF